MQQKISGTGVALITPFTESGAIDFRALAHMVDRVIAGGCSYILVLGTTSEAPTLEPEERSAVLKFVRDRAAGRVGLMAGIGGNSTKAVVRNIQSLSLEGYSSILSVCPYYNKPTQEGLFQHFRAIAEVSPLPVVLYNIPSRTGVNMLPETVARLRRECPVISGIKEASGDIAQMEAVVRLTDPDFSVICGDDALTVEAMRRGACGVLSVLVHLYPEATAGVVEACQEGRYDEADGELRRLDAITRALFAEGNPVGIKGALAEKGLCGPTVRLPLVEASRELRAKLRELIATYEK